MLTVSTATPRPVTTLPRNRETVFLWWRCHTGIQSHYLRKDRISSIGVDSPFTHRLRHIAPSLEPKPAIDIQLNTGVRIVGATADDSYYQSGGVRPPH